MTHRKVKKQVIYLIFAVTSLLLVISLTLVELKLNKTPNEPQKNEYVNKTIFENNDSSLSLNFKLLTHI